MDLDCLVVGAGVAGLTALAQLDRAGYRVLCLEARDRIGGRIFTVHDPLSPTPLELGAEFIHGRPPETWEILRTARLSVYNCADSFLHIRNGQVQEHDGTWDPVAKIMSDMEKEAARGSHDKSFAEFLDGSSYPPEAKELSASFVEGFNAAHKELVGIASLAQDGRASEAIDGDRSFRIANGYDSVPLHLYGLIPNAEAKLRLNQVVKTIEWSSSSVTINTVSSVTGESATFTARRAVITVPLGVLQAKSERAGGITWRPAPDVALGAASQLAFGQVMRVVIRFREPFWEDNDKFSEAGFLLSNEVLFPTWWTSLALRTPILTGWSAGPHADALLNQPDRVIIRHAIASLTKILNVPQSLVNNLIEGVYFHDWHADPFARGAYSYVPAGALEARRQLAEPVADTLFFAGEATELNGHSATVHGAIASGSRAAQQIIDSGKTHGR